MDELDHIISDGRPSTTSDTARSSSQQPWTAPQKTIAAPDPAASLLDSLTGLEHRTPPAPPQISGATAAPPAATYEAWDDLFADAGSTSSAAASSPAASGMARGAEAQAAAESAWRHTSAGGAAQADLDRWFAEADADRNGRVAGGEAREFFKRTSLPFADLSRVWSAAKSAAPAEGNGLTPAQFAAAMRIVAYAQMGRSLEDVSATQAAAADGGWQRLTGQPLPAPRILPVGTAAAPITARISSGVLMPPPAPQPPQQSPSRLGRAPSPTKAAVATLRKLSLGRETLQKATPSASSLTRPSPPPRGGSMSANSSVSQLSPDSPSESPTATYFDDSSDNEGIAVEGRGRPGPQLEHARTIAVPHENARAAGKRARIDFGQISQSVTETGTHGKRQLLHRRVRETPSFHALEVGSAALVAAPLSIDVRCPPLHPKRSAMLHMLAAASGSLFAGPAANGAFIQWSSTGGELQLPHPNREQETDMPLRVATEDPDAAAGWEVPLHEHKAVTALHVDIHNNLLWTGHADGMVSGHALGKVPGSAVTRRYSFPAFRGGSVTALCATAWGDLWTANSRGGIRIWPSQHGLPSMAEVECRELRRGGSGNRPHGGPITFLALPISGQVVWSGSGKTLCLWSADTGAWLGKIGAERDLEEPPVPLFDVSGDFSGSDHGGHLRINSSKVSCC